MQTLVIVIKIDRIVTAGRYWDADENFSPSKSTVIYLEKNKKTNPPAIHTAALRERHRKKAFLLESVFFTETEGSMIATRGDVAKNIILAIVDTPA